MRAAAPASYHLDFYRYWLAKRGALPIPLHSAIDPGEIPALVPYVGIIGRTGGELRYRLAGTALSAELGRDLTGSAVGSYIRAEERLREIGQPASVRDATHLEQLASNWELACQMP